MKILKKITLGLSLAVILFIVGLTGVKHASAAPVTAVDWVNAKYTMSNAGNTITIKVGSNTIVFQLNGAGNSTSGRFYKQSNPPANTLCANDSIISIAANEFDPSKVKLNGKIFAHYQNASTRTCESFGGANNQIPISIDNPNPVVCSSGICNPNATTPPAAGSTTSGTANPSCESNFDSGWEWALCPAFKLADSAAGAFNEFIEDQLCFKTTAKATSSTGTNVVCKGNNNLDTGVKNAWNIFKNIASALLVIAMLVIVISQAVSAGPFDAYTVRKMLPRLVAAVILMQLSWWLLSWLIDISNDVGSAVGQLMLAPFGGASNMTLEHLMGKAFAVHTTGTNDTFAFFTVLAAGTAAFIVSIPTLGILGLYVVLALFTAFLVLIFRKLLIIMLVILAPIALVAWLLPGTEKYWKLWRDSFTKLLLMFPMIMALLAAGKIFASITAGNTASMFNLHLAVAHLGPIPVPYMASVTSFAELIIVIGAFFAPYFLLPQTYRWGGSAMGAIGKGVQQGMERGAKPGKEYLQWRQGLSPWKQARAARRAKQEIRAKTEFYEGLGAEGARGTVRRARLGGVVVPTPGQLRRDRALRESIVTGGAQRAEEEALKEANLGLEHELATDPAALADHDQYVIDIARAGVGATVHGRVRNEADWRAATEKMIAYGGPNNRVFEELHADYMTRGGADRERWEKILNANAPAILPKFPFMYKDRDYSQVDATTSAHGDLNTTITQLNAESFTKDGIEGEAVETILGHLSTLIRDGDVRANPAATPAQVARGADAQTRLATMYALFNQTITSETTNRRVNPASARAMLAAVGGAPAVLTTINNGRRGRGPGVPEIDAGVINATIRTSPDPDMPAAMSNLVTHVREDGILR